MHQGTDVNSIRKESRKTAIIGASASGLFTAYLLQKLGHQVTIFERSTEIGAECRALDIDGIKFSLGGHDCTSKAVELQKLCDELGIEIAVGSPLFKYDISEKTIVNFNVENPQSLKWIPKKGFDSVYRKIANLIPDIRYNSIVEYIKRDEENILIKTQKLEKFDNLFIACSYNSALSFLDGTVEEKEIFSKICYLDYYTTLCRVEGISQQGFYLITSNRQNPQYHGQSVAFLHQYAHSNIYSFYSYGNPGINPEDIGRFLKKDIELMGGKLLEIIHQEKLLYFSHLVDQDNFADGFHKKLENLQGKNSTHYVGSLNNFEDVEANLNYIQHLIAKHFAINTQPRGNEVISNWLGEQIVRTTLTINNLNLDQILGRIFSKTLTQLDRTILITQYLQLILANSLELGSNYPEPAVEFFSLGLDSIHAVEIFQKISEQLNVMLEPSVFFDYPTIEALADYLNNKLNKENYVYPFSPVIQEKFNVITEI